MTLSSIAGLLTHPGTQAMLLLLLALALAALRRVRAASVFTGVALTWLWIASSPAFALWLQNGLALWPPKAADAYATADAIVVLGGGVLPDAVADSPDDEAAQTTRLGFGLQLYRAARAPVMLLSGGDQARHMARDLENQGVPARSLLLEDTSANTHENAANSAGILRQHGMETVLLVTTDIHMPRAAASFAHAGIRVIPAPTPDPGLASHAKWWPNRAALTLSARCLREHVGIWSYRWRGWTWTPEETAVHADRMATPSLRRA
nr:YdcF family protein [Luteibacter sp. Sphag1AF]